MTDKSEYVNLKVSLGDIRSLNEFAITNLSVLRSKAEYDEDKKLFNFCTNTLEYLYESVRKLGTIINDR